MTFEGLDELYREVILDHFKNPRHHGKIASHDVEQEGFNPLCGDSITLQLKFEGGKIKSVGHWGKGCSISQASVSILTDEILGKDIEEAQEEIQLFKDMMQGKDVKQKIEKKESGDMEALSGVQKFPVRIKCALLPWTTLEEALHTWKKIQNY